MDLCSPTNGKRGNGREEWETDEPNFKRLRTGDDGNEEERRRDDENRKSEESHFLRLYTLILECIIKIKKVPDMDIMGSIDHIVALFDSGKHSKIDFAKWEIVCAYLYRYGSHGAGFARCRIFNALKNCSELKTVQRTSDLRIVCLGTGPGNDAIGFCSALSEFQYPENLTVTLVDKYKEWSLCHGLANLLIREEKLGNVSELFQKSNVSLSSIQVNLPGNADLDKKYFRNLKEADIILISKLFTGLDTATVKACIQSLKENMKKEAFILLNDQFAPSHWTAFKVLYTWGPYTEYKSSALAKRRFGSDDRIPSKLPITVLKSKN